MGAKRIGFDAKRLFHNHSGLGNYSRTLVRGIHKLRPELECVLYSPRIDQSDFEEEFAHHQLRSKAGLFSSYWRSVSQARSWASDALTHYHGLSHELPFSARLLKSVKKIVTIHDLIQLRYPSDHKWHDRWAYTSKIKRSLDMADAVICISENTKGDVVEYFGTEMEKLHVVYQSIDPRFHQRASAQMLQSIKDKYQLPKEYILFVGGTRPRKNLTGLLEAYAKVDIDIPLCLVGNEKSYTDYLQQHEVRQKRILCCQCSIDEMPMIYQLATVVAYPSHYEGFGLPILEALASGAPVVSSSSSSMPEAAGSAALLVDPHDTAMLADALTRSIQDQDLRMTLLEEGSVQLKKFSLENFVQGTYQVYDSL